MADAADEAAAGTAAEAPVAAPLGHYARLQEIEERVVRAIEAAGFAMGELAKERADIDKALLNAAVKGFLEQLQEAQQFVLEAIKAAAPDRDFEANNYFLMLQAMAAAEKLDAVSVHISGISKVLREHQQQLQQQPAGGQQGVTPAQADGMATPGAS